MKNLIKSVISVMNEVKGIEKSMTIGEGKMSYKGVPDKEVKKIIGSSMAKHGLCILPIGIKPTIKIERWEEADYQGKIKTKQSVFTEVIANYLLMHESGESLEICGYGHGVDSQDKGAGKATTYALKYALLYSFLVPTGDIDDADLIHSNDYPVKQIPYQKKVQNEVPKSIEPKIELNEFQEIQTIVNASSSMGELSQLWADLEDYYKVIPSVKDLFTNRKKQLS